MKDGKDLPVIRKNVCTIVMEMEFVKMDSASVKLINLLENSVIKKSVLIIVMETVTVLKMENVCAKQGLEVMIAPNHTAQITVITKEIV